MINAAELVYLHEMGAPPTLIDSMIDQEGRSFADEDAWTDHLIAIDVTGTKAVRLATEAAVAGSLTVPMVGRVRLSASVPAPANGAK